MEFLFVLPCPAAFGSGVRGMKMHAYVHCRRQAQKKLRPSGHLYCLDGFCGSTTKFDWHKRVLCFQIKQFHLKFLFQTSAQTAAAARCQSAAPLLPSTAAAHPLSALISTKLSAVATAGD
jgi:hypothetical protein